MIVKILNWAH